MKGLVMETTWIRHPLNTLKPGKPVDVRRKFIDVLL